jgi:hypothetical protein
VYGLGGIPYFTLPFNLCFFQNFDDFFRIKHHKWCIKSYYVVTSISRPEFSRFTIQRLYTGKLGPACRLELSTHIGHLVAPGKERAENRGISEKRERMEEDDCRLRLIIEN